MIIRLVGPVFGGLVGGCLTLGCIGVSQKPAPSGQSAGNVGASSTTAPPAQGCSASAPAPDGAVDDFEDGDNRLSMLGGRDGYWWHAHDENGSTIGPDPFNPEPGGAGGSQKAMHITGETKGGDAWGANFGAMFVSQGVIYDATRYSGISFKAKAGPNSAHKVRFQIADVNTHKEGGVCSKSCWNHFGQDVTFTNEWKEFVVPFSSTHQEAGWGDPRPPSITVDRLIAFDWQVKGGGPFDFWIDDIQFIQCK